MDYQERAKYLNGKISALHLGWGNLPIWAGEPSVVHMIYSAILAVIQNSDFEWVALEIDDEHDRDRTALTITIWTDDLVVHAVRKPGALHPVVKVEKRSAVTGFELLAAPLLTSTAWGFDEHAVAIRLTYPTFSAVVRDKRGERLLAALPAFIADL